MADVRKRETLRAQGTLYATPDKVKAEVFSTHPEFFDSEDKLQVRYELLRAAARGEMTVSQACQTYGVSRQTFYTLQRSFQARGVSGLIDGKRGRKGPLKASLEVVEFVRTMKQEQPRLSGAELGGMVEERFGIRLHRRTVERLLHIKKPQSAAPATG